MPPLEGEVPNEREAEGFVRKLSKKTPQSARSGCQLPFQGSQGGFAARVAKLATPTGSGGNQGCVPFNVAHSLSQPVRAASSLREGAKGTSCQRVQTGFCVVLNRAVQKPNVWVQVRCVIVRRHCRPM